uniref:3-hydroxyisobutyrate dehydrogenase-like NAD-binding domain-containing protein n=1 Tax=Tetradesmus obliquus TaxID=3088 RepID=A0A383VQ04_TETOB|eukprot:jgi/Sobl393_1/20131/SZX67595.1
MVGGNKAAAEAAAPILRTMGSHIIHCGDHGAGISAKLCNNLVLAASMAALAEALALGKRMGLDPAVLTDVVNRGAARCWSSETYNPVPGVLQDPLLPSNRGYKAGLPLSNVSEHLNMLLEAAKVAKSPTPGLPLSNVSEHLNMLLEAAKVAKSPTPVARSVQSLYERVEQEGLGDKDFSSVFRYVYGSGCDNTEWKDGQQLFSSHVP